MLIPTEAFQAYVEHPQVRRLYLTVVGSYLQAATHHYERKEGIEDYILIYCTEGSGILQIQGHGTIHLHANEAICLPRFLGHRYQADEDDPWSILWVHFKGDETSLYPLEECKVIHCADDSTTQRMHSYFELLFQVLEQNYTLGNFIYISQLLSLILTEIYYREKTVYTKEQNKHVTNIIRYMYQNLERDVPLEELTTAFDLSKSYVNAIFKKYTQHSPMDFFTRLKMKEACTLLRSTNDYVYEIAQKLGYPDPYYFSRLFKKIIGVSPREYKDGDYMYYDK